LFHIVRNEVRWTTDSLFGSLVLADGCGDLEDIGDLLMHVFAKNASFVTSLVLLRFDDHFDDSGGQIS
jgi:hypothetical protein